MKPFLDSDFLLHTETARRLFHEHAAKMPIIDYHCHLNPREIAEDKRYRSITELWLGGDHYKWRAMRANGVDERFITGDASDWEKFEKWAETLPYTLRNPLYHWSHLELKTAFGIEECLNPASAKRIYDRCNELLQTPEYSARGLMRRYHVETVCTTDDPIDDLRWHRQIKESGFGIKVLPAWRPDKAMALDQPAAYQAYIKQLEAASGISIARYADLKAALQKRHDFFEANGCRLSDHGMDRFYDDAYTEGELDAILAKALGGQAPSMPELNQIRSALLHDLAVMDAASGWAQQFHYGPLRNNNARMFALKGPDTGFDSIGEDFTAREMAHFFSRLDAEGCLAKTIVYNLNPAANTMTAAMMGNFQDGSVPGKMQWGAAWWFLDQKDGITKQLDTLSMQGLLSRFVGMLTDSRSFLSYPRHEYFRRILCDLLGRDVENGELPECELPRIAAMVEDICYNNAKRYFGF
ncbi:MAG: glucuronate isomerase [Paludibacteraceae bacterium]|nr:glucuronate isomerase [Paludibacteraceae bacterium]